MKLKYGKISYNWRSVIETLIKDKNNKSLWNYVTALRGPDHEGCDLKGITTVILRGNPCHNAFGIGDYGPGSPDGNYDNPSSHFAHHYTIGLLALEQALLIEYPNHHVVVKLLREVIESWQNYINGDRTADRFSKYIIASNKFREKVK